MTTARMVPGGGERLVADMAAFVEFADGNPESLRRGMTLCVGDARALLEAMAVKRAELLGARAEIARLLRGEFTVEEIQEFRPRLRDTVSLDEFAEACRTVMVKVYGRCPWDDPPTDAADPPYDEQREDAPNAVRSAESLDHATGCDSCHDPCASPRAAVHDSGNPWLTKLVCTSCGALWGVDGVDRR